MSERRWSNEEMLGLLGNVGRTTPEQAAQFLGPIANISEKEAANLLFPMSSRPSTEKPRASGKSDRDELERLRREKAAADRAELERLREAQARATSRGPTGDFAPAPNAEQQAEQLSSAAVMGRRGVRRFIDNLLAVPRVVGEGVASAAALPQAAIDAGANVLSGQPANFNENFRARFGQEREQFPARNLRGVGQLDTGQVLAGLETAGTVGGPATDPMDRRFGIAVPDVQRRGAGEIYNEAVAEDRDAQRALETLYPGATLAGDILGDVATVVSARVPLARARAPGQAAERAELTRTFRRNELTDRVSGEIDDVVSQKIIPALLAGRRGFGELVERAGEAGLEGATLAMLNEGDPLSTGMYAAGGQAAGSAMLYLASHPIKALLPTIGAMWVANEMYNAAAPGEQNFFESKDFAIQKAVAFFGLGALSGLAGAGRFRNQYQERFPALFDSLTAAPRAAAISGLLSDYVNGDREGDDLARRVSQRIVQAPDRFSRDQIRSLERAMMSGREGAFAREVRRLMEASESFRRAVEGDEDE